MRGEPGDGKQVSGEMQLEAMSMKVEIHMQLFVQR